ncbi:uncharacterized protein LOC131669041 [Phymastichus coffea]|uniref:uncharacterized protein LOC131669041 n=1 Tax=Phymastichus coffea TaxID=108790 RepID=UPI00273B032F|nr:uncharacterized protein LOC131669041 [Phymastichus coffea]
MTIFIVDDVADAHYAFSSPIDRSLSWSGEIHVDYREFDSIKPPTYDTLASADNHSFALLRCKRFGDAYFKNCSLTTRTHTFDGRIYSSECEIQPPLEHNVSAVLQGGITFLRHDRVLVSWKEEHKGQGWRMYSRVIFMHSCRASHFIRLRTNMDEDSAVFAVLGFANSFVIIFGEQESRTADDYCKVFTTTMGNLCTAFLRQFQQRHYREMASLLLEKLIPWSTIPEKVGWKRKIFLTWKMCIRTRLALPRFVGGRFAFLINLAAS